MSDDPDTYVFRPRRLSAPLLIVAALPFNLFGFTLLVAFNPQVCVWWLGFGFAFFGILMSVGGMAYLSTVVTVGPDGISKSVWWYGGFVADWSEVEWWTVCRQRNAEHPHEKELRLRIHGLRWEQIVLYAEVNRPGFEDFVAAMRTYGGDLEVEPPKEWS